MTDIRRHTFEREDGAEVSILYRVTHYGAPPSGLSGPADHADPGEPPEWQIVDIRENGARTFLDPKEARAVDDWIAEHGCKQEPPDPDRYRD